MDATLIAPILMVCAVLYFHILFWWDKRRTDAQQAKTQRLLDEMDRLNAEMRHAYSDLAEKERVLRRCMLDVAKYSRWSK